MDSLGCSRAVSKSSWSYSSWEIGSDSCCVLFWPPPRYPSYLLSMSQSGADCFPHQQERALLCSEGNSGSNLSCRLDVARTGTGPKGAVPAPPLSTSRTWSLTVKPVKTEASGFPAAPQANPIQQTGLHLHRAREEP